MYTYVNEQYVYTEVMYSNTFIQGMLLVKVDGRVYISRILHSGLIHRQGKFVD